MKALVLTLPEQRERLDAARMRLSERGLDIHFVCGIQGEVAGLRATHTYEHDNPGSNYVIGPKTVGIFLGHYIAWAVRDALEDEHVLVMEDDAVFPENFDKKFKQAMDDAPKDFDILFIGSCCTDGYHKHHIAGDVYELHYPQCLHAYVMSKKAAFVLLRECRDVNGPVDCVLKINKFYGLKVYTVLPRIVDQFETVIPT